MKIVHAFDPGATTGHVICEVADDPSGYIMTNAEEIGGGVIGFVGRELDLHGASIVIYESFYLFYSARNHQVGSSFPSAEVIGILKYLSVAYDYQLVAQSASCKEAFTGSNSKHLPLMAQKATGEHIKDAARHLLYWFYSQRSKH